MYREANFLRAFHAPDSDTNQEDRNLVKTLLELEMCVALRTLPQEEVVQWLPQGDLEVKFPSVHLNIANSLVQGSFISTDARQCSRSILLDSVDPEVRQWPSIRDRQLAAKPARSNDFVPSVPLSAYAPIFDDAIKGNTQILGELQSFNSELKIPCDEDFLHGGSLKDYEDTISRAFRPGNPPCEPVRKPTKPHRNHLRWSRELSFQRPIHIISNGRSSLTLRITGDGTKCRKLADLAFQSSSIWHIQTRRNVNRSYCHRSSLLPRIFPIAYRS